MRILRRSLRRFTLVTLLLVLSFPFSALGSTHGPDFTSSPGSCPVRSLFNEIAPRKHLQCDISEALPLHTPEELILAVGQVAELNETSLKRVLELMKGANSSSYRHKYLAVLYYADWCPFSRELRPVYSAVARLYPDIPHVAIEESNLRPSVLSHFGVHSFPVLYLHTHTARLRYRGSRTVTDFSNFYTNTTGFTADNITVGDKGLLPQACPLDLASDLNIKKYDTCPWTWASHPDKWLQESTCLYFSALFVILRVLWLTIPRIYTWYISTRLFRWARRKWLGGQETLEAA